MGSIPTEQELMKALSAAGTAHHDYESNFLQGAPDEHWPGWYAAYVLGRLGDFTTPTTLAGWLSEVSGEGDWSQNAATHVVSNAGEAKR